MMIASSARAKARATFFDEVELGSARSCYDNGVTFSSSYYRADFQVKFSSAGRRRRMESHCCQAGRTEKGADAVVSSNHLTGT
jgi:hypothetical protein